jgi:hypothetical protein
VLPFYFVYRSWSRLKLFQIQMSLNLEKGFENQKRDFISKQPLGPNSRKKPNWPLLIFFSFSFFYSPERPTPACFPACGFGPFPLPTHSKFAVTARAGPTDLRPPLSKAQETETGIVTYGTFPLLNQMLEIAK